MDKVKEIQGIIVTPLKIIPHSLGNIFHGMKKSDRGYNGFGEIYLSSIKKNKIKAWKKHKKMTLNLIVIKGKIRFVFYDDRKVSKTYGTYSELILSKSNFSRITVPPMIWFGFQGLTNENLLINIADLEHNPEEIERLDIENSVILFNWNAY
jgi:dTDP-4-dehydrorhamnose 3,5-epimerase